MTSTNENNPSETPPPPSTNPNPNSSSSTTAAPREIEVATALMSIWGPCRGVSDAYLACVATSGLGMCKPIRYAFQQCAADNYKASTDSLKELGSHMCGHFSDGSEERDLCAAQIVFAQHHSTASNDNSQENK